MLLPLPPMLLPLPPMLLPLPPMLLPLLLPPLLLMRVPSPYSAAAFASGAPAPLNVTPLLTGATLPLRPGKSESRLQATSPLPSALSNRRPRKSRILLMAFDRSGADRVASRNIENSGAGRC